MALKLCLTPGCPNLVEEGHCREHGAGWPTKVSLAYRGEWPRIRAAVLAEHPRCTDCGARAIQVDHIVQLADGGTHARSNLRPLCRRCHDDHTYGRVS